MKSLAIGAAILVCLGLSACAGTPQRVERGRDGAMVSDVDAGKIAAVNQWAWQRGATVVWVNYPRPRPSKNNDG
ncbi:MAG TPA: hypothetical protein VGC55_09015 [Dokdonella sp.]